MARKALIEKCKKKWWKAQRQKTQGKKVTFSTKLYHRCVVCWRVHGYVWKFDMCRICIRERANKWEIVGLKKSSW